MARTLVYSPCNARAVGAQEFAPAVCEPSATRHPPVRLNCQAYLKRSSPSNILRVSCAGKSRQIVKAGNWRAGGKTLQGCKPSSSFTGVLPESFRCVANRHSQRLNGNQLLPNRQTVIKA